jgi:hypothetical protein
VEDGDQGKNRRPRDHNRDYGPDSIYPEVRAVKDRVPRWSDGRLRFALDIHCPWIRGHHNEHVYVVGSKYDRVWREQKRFSDVLEEVRRGALPYAASGNLPFGHGWNTEENYGGLTTAGDWMASLPEDPVRASFEIPYANAGGVAVTAETAREFGRDLARALDAYLRS